MTRLHVNRCWTVGTAIVMIMGVWVRPASAGSIKSPTSVIGNTLGTFSSIPANAIDFTINGSGVPAFVSGVTDFATYVGTNPAHAGFASGNAWASAGGVLTGDIDYNLGGLFSITQFAMWSQGATGQEINSFTIFTSLNAAFAGAVNVGTFIGAQNSLVQTFNIADSVGQYVRLRINSNYGSGTTTTLGEIALDVGPAAAVPEPATLLLLGSGLGVAAARRRRLTKRT
jgi:PEP-CTERM motif/Sad1 / UNC-like C-terminal